MKPLEILSQLPQWAKAPPESILDSQAFALPCRLGDESVVLRHASIEPAESDTLALSVTFGDEPHTLRLARSPRFPELDKIWVSRADVPEAILLALVERECGPFLQMLENTVRKQLRLVGIDVRQETGDVLHVSCFASNAPNSPLLTFSLSRSAAVVSALGVLRNIDLAHEAIRSQTLAAEVEYAAFQLPEADIASLAPGDAVMLPEIGTLPPRLVVDGRFVVDANGVSPYQEDSMCRVREATGRSITLGELFDAADGSRGAVNVANVEMLPTTNVANANAGLGIGTGNTGNIIQLRLVKDGKTVSAGRLDRLGDQPAFIVEAKE